MNRRTYLRAAGAAGALGVAGCLDTVPGAVSGSSETVLGPPEQDLSASSHPTYGDELPSFSVPDPLADETITDDRFHGERAILMTFFFTTCPDGACPALLQRLVRSQFRVAQEGLEDEVAFLAVTFDPERDTADALAEEAETFDVDLDAGNWHFLRPETEEAAMDLVDGDFGMPVQKVDPEELDDHDHGDEDDHGHGDDEGDGDHHGHEDHDYTFYHYNLILLANDRGVVERSYPQATIVPSSEIEDDLLTVLEG